MKNLLSKVSTTLANWSWVSTLKNAVKNVLNPVLIIACLVGIFYAIWVGVVFAKADDKSKRDEAKQKLITVIIGIVAAVVLIILFYWLIWMIEKGKFSWMSNKDVW